MIFRFFKQRRLLLAALETLNANIVTLNETIAKAVAVIQAPPPAAGVPEAEVQAAADAVAAANATLAAALPQG
jgi:hypothetical protein